MRANSVRAMAVLAALALAAHACSGGGGGGGGPTPPQFGTVSGQVTAAGAGVPGVTVGVQGGASTTTDAAGVYTIANVATGARTVAITLPNGFITATLGEQTTQNVNVSANQTATASWTLKRGVIVTAAGTSFTPADVTISVGQTVRWVNEGGVHTVTPSNPGQAGVWADAPLGANSAFEHTFAVASVYPYVCQPHQAAGMTGSVTVQ
ncbi:MAG TPA: plastocyanin/azurin family copper-binding protein [Longimicrobiaceae bacterium]|nr:plastocyanin/azurin family copper-binding protein [Longimicrobiaceae bacterium]